MRRARHSRPSTLLGLVVIALALVAALGAHALSAAVPGHTATSQATTHLTLDESAGFAPGADGPAAPATPGCPEACSSPEDPATLAAVAACFLTVLLVLGWFLLPALKLLAGAGVRLSGSPPAPARPRPTRGVPLLQLLSISRT
ncbi:hypothetical protein [Leucobacter sp. M11]|uniref:hypothetical protein n=1 Tax=Leucobacter sp. M11 TaxID=2993565 RepID=UPI002D809C08|nr:hypothetical protein [Leucobacter sp. M11]